MAGFSGRDRTTDLHIYLFDRATGRLSRHIANLPNAILHLAYSRDGAYDDSSYWLDFDHERRLVSSSDDGFIRLYDARFNRIAVQRAPGGTLPYSAVFSPDGRKIAVGFENSPAVNVLAAGDLHFLYAADSRGIDNGSLSKVGWSADGQMLYAGGIFHDRSNRSMLLAWTQAGLGTRQIWPLATSTIMDFKPLMQQHGLWRSRPELGRGRSVRSQVARKNRIDYRSPGQSS
ncbi:MAG: WD40 repeat domain-containing protein [Methylococcales bacterium]